MDPRSLRLAKVFPLEGTASSIDFDSTGELCIVSSPSTASLLLYDCLEGTLRKTIFSKKYGVGAQVRFTHHSNAIIYASGRETQDHAIRYLSLHDNAYLRYFKGHQTPVCALEMSPCSDLFLSGSPNDTIRLWDLRSAHCEGQMNIINSGMGGAPLIGWDPQGMVVAIALESRYLRLYDVSGLEKGPFAAFEIEDPSSNGHRSHTSTWSSIAFSPDGKEILIGTSGGRVAYVIDSFDGYVKQTLTLTNSSRKAAASSGASDFQACWSADSQYVFCGDASGVINVWRSRSDGDKSSLPFHQLEGHVSPPTLIKANPKYSMLASVCSNLAFWLPSQS